MNPFHKTDVEFLTATDREEGQRLDNFLFRHLKHLPKTHVYRLLRKGEVRVNKKRVGPQDRLHVGDFIRIPPLFLEKEETVPSVLNRQQEAYLRDAILLETEDFIVMNKPAGVSVHAGSDTRVGLIEALRIKRQDLKFIELVHRLDKDTSGCLLLAKKPAVLKAFHAKLRERDIKKTYHLVVKGVWPKSVNRVDLSVEGKPSLTTFQILSRGEDSTYLSALLHTGRQHQIRIHTQASGHPIIGDNRYGDFAFNRAFAKKTAERGLFLHAYELFFTWQNHEYKIQAPLPVHFMNLFPSFKAAQIVCS